MASLPNLTILTRWVGWWCLVARGTVAAVNPYRILASALLCASLCGCAHVTPQAAVDGARTALKAVDVASDAAVDAVVAARAAAVARCEAELGASYTQEQARDCLGPMATPLEPIARQAREAYQQAIDALDAVEAALREISTMVEAAKREGAP